MILWYNPSFADENSKNIPLATILWAFVHTYFQYNYIVI